MNQRTKKITALAMLSAIAYVLAAISGMLPGIMFLKYDPKDVIIVIGGFIFGPMSAFIISLIVSFIEMVTVSDSGIIGFFMNALSSCAFACTAAIIYKKRHNLKWAAIGLIIGCVVTTVVMILWNYLLTPLYLAVDRSEVVPILVPLILPFNLIKGALNAAITMIVYKPIVTALRKSGLLPKSEGGRRQMKLGVILISLVVLLSAVAAFLVLGGYI